VTQSHQSFIVLSVVLLMGIGLSPRSSPVPAPVTTEVPTPAVALATRTSYPAPVAEAPFGWTVTVKEYK